MTTKATTTDTAALVLKDGSGEYIVIPQGELERWRLPQDQNDEIERLLAEQEDVQGHILPALLAVAFVSGFSAGFSVTRAVIEKDKD